MQFILGIIKLIVNCKIEKKNGYVFIDLVIIILL